MKYQLAVAIGIVVVLGGMWANAHFGQVVEVENTTLPIQEVKDPDCMDVVGDEDACKAAEDVLQRKAWEEELNALESNFASTMAVYEAEKAEYESKKTDLEKKLGTY